MKRALCIGISDYIGLENDLTWPNKDAKDWAKVLSEKGFDTIKTLTDKLATRENILANLKYLVNVSKPGDSIFIQYSGHGTQVPDESGDETDRMDEALCPYDLWENGPVLDDELWKIFRSKEPNVKIVVISDSCHSGSVVRAFNAPHLGKKKFLHCSNFMSRATPAWATSFPRDPAFVVDDKVPWPVLLISGCQDTEYSYDASEYQNGAFTYWALQTLKTLPETATYLDWYNAIRKHLPSKDYPQCPNIIGSYQGHKIFS